VILYAYKTISDFCGQMGQCCQQPLDLGQMCPQNIKQTVFSAKEEGKKKNKNYYYHSHGNKKKHTQEIVETREEVVN